MMIQRAFLAATLGAMAAPAVFAGVLEFNFVLTEDQEVPPTGSNAVGAAQLLYDPSDQTFDLDLMVFGIDLADLHGVGPNATPVHIHLAPPGVNGPIIVDVGFLASFFEDGQGIRLQISDALFGGQQGNLFSDPDLNEAALLSGNTYLNVHTMGFPGGEIRGNIPAIPAPGAVAVLAIGGVMRSRRRRT